MAARAGSPSDPGPGPGPGVTRRLPWADGGVEQPPEEGHVNGSTTGPQPVVQTPAVLLPDGRHALSGISLRGYCLGIASGVTGVLTLLLLLHSNALWRSTFFILILSIFHFLEFYVTARYNTAYAEVKAYLLSSNGTAYNVAHTMALLETTVSHSFYSYPKVFPAFSQIYLMSLGLTLLVIGQLVRSFAMKQAGQNFNHTVQVRKAAGHELVQTGIYAYLRHPSYFGFFWWSLGSQIILGNPICFMGFALVLYKFFSERIKKEELFLVKFFGDDYIQYRQRTPVGIPFIK